MSIVITGCASRKKIDISVTEIPRTELGIEVPALPVDLGMEDITFYTVRKGKEIEDTAKAWEPMIEEDDQTLVGLLMSDEDHKELSRINRLIIEYIKLLQKKLLDAKDYYEGEKDTERDND